MDSIGLACVRCGTATARDGWCPRCLNPPPAEGAATRSPAAAPVLVRTGRHTDASTVSFGPVGRTLWTVAIVSPPALVLWVTSLLVGWGFAALWWGVITPWALRDLWRPSGRRRRSL